MKKLLSLLGGVAIIGGASTTIVACGIKSEEAPKENKGKLANLIKEAELLIENSEKEESVNKALNAAIGEAKKALNDEAATEESFEEVAAKLAKAMDEFNNGEVQDLHKKLQDRINGTNKNKTEIENENNDNGWDAIAEKSHKDFDIAIKAAEEVIKQNKLTKEEVTEQLEKLAIAIENFKLSLPQQIISEAINFKKDDIKNIIFKDWSYDSFFGFDEESQSDGNARLVNILLNDTKKLTNERHYTELEQTKLGELIVKYFIEKVKLVYLNEQDGQQKIKNIIDRDEEKTGLEQILHDNVSEEFPDADLKDPSFWEKNPKLSLGIKFDTNNLNDETKEFWTFNLVSDITKEDRKYIQGLFVEAQELDGGRIILNVPKGLSKGDYSFHRQLNPQIQEKVFYGKRFISKFTADWKDLPSNVQVRDGKIGWITKREYPIAVNHPQNTNNQLFNIKTLITINIG